MQQVALGFALTGLVLAFVSGGAAVFCGVVAASFFAASRV